jgi:hypothetical protein
VNGPEPSVPWSLSEARTSFIAVTLGGALLVWSWWQVSGLARLSGQTTWVVVGVLGVMVIGLGSLLWVTSGRRAVRERRNDLAGLLEDVLAARYPREQAAEPETPATPAAAGLVALRGSTRYHRNDCLLVHGKEVTALPGPGRRSPCEMCEP